MELNLYSKSKINVMIDSLCFDIAKIEIDVPEVQPNLLPHIKNAWLKRFPKIQSEVFDTVSSFFPGLVHILFVTFIVSQDGSVFVYTSLFRTTCTVFALVDQVYSDEMAEFDLRNFFEYFEHQTEVTGYPDSSVDENEDSSTPAGTHMYFTVHYCEGGDDIERGCAFYPASCSFQCLLFLKHVIGSVQKAILDTGIHLSEATRHLYSLHQSVTDAFYQLDDVNTHNILDKIEHVRTMRKEGRPTHPRDYMEDSD